MSSAITVVKSEEENEDGTTKISYDMDSIDTDEDGNTTSYVTNIYSGVTKQTIDGLGNADILYYYVF